METAAHYTVSSLTDPGTALQTHSVSEAGLIGAGHRWDFYAIAQPRKEIQRNKTSWSQHFFFGQLSCEKWLRSLIVNALGGNAHTCGKQKDKIYSRYTQQHNQSRERET